MRRDRSGAAMSTGKIVIGNIDGRLYLRWFLDRALLQQYLDSNPALDDVVGITADGLRLEISAHDGPEAAAKAAHDLRDMAALAMQPVRGSS
jgi:hypothetical protein